MLPDLLARIDTLSDVLFVIAAPLAAYFFLSYGLGSPWYKVWQHGWLGVMTFLHGLSVVALVSLIVYTTIYGQRADEWYRSLIAALLVISLLGKIVILHYERHMGTLERRRHQELAREPRRNR